MRSGRAEEKPSAGEVSPSVNQSRMAGFIRILFQGLFAELRFLSDVSLGFLRNGLPGSVEEQVSRRSVFKEQVVAVARKAHASDGQRGTDSNAQDGPRNSAVGIDERV